MDDFIEGIKQIIAEREQAQQARRCPFCKRSTKFEDHGPFKDERSFREFQISGLCQTCQEEFFCSGKPDCNKPCCISDDEYMLGDPLADD